MTEKKEPEKGEKPFNWKNFLIIFFASILILTGIIVIIYFIHSLTGNYHLSGSKDVNVDASAKVGDFIGGVVGAVWSLAGVLLFFLALRMQKQELEIQRQELIETRRVFVSQKEQLEKQQKETTFFRILDNYRGFVKSLTHNEKEGYELIDYWYRKFKSNIPRHNKLLESTILEFNSSYRYSPNWFLNVHNNITNQLYWNICQIIDYIEENLTDNPELYHKIFINSLTAGEQFLFGLSHDLCEKEAKYKDYEQLYLDSGSVFKSALNEIPYLEIQLVSPQIELMPYEQDYNPEASLTIKNKDSNDIYLSKLYLEYNTKISDSPSIARHPKILNKLLKPNDEYSIDLIGLITRDSYYKACGTQEAVDNQISDWYNSVELVFSQNKSSDNFVFKSQLRCDYFQGASYLEDGRIDIRLTTN